MSTSNQIIQAAHNIPTVNTLQFNLKYYEGVAIFPGIILILGFICLLSYQLYLLCRYCNRSCCEATCCRCCTNSENDSYKIKIKQYTLISIKLFYILLIIALISISLSWLGNVYLTNALQNTSNNVGMYTNDLTIISKSGINIESYMNIITNNYINNNTNPCSQAFTAETNNFKSDFLTNTSYVRTSGETLNSETGDLPIQLKHIQDNINNYIPLYHIAFYILYAITTLFIILFSITYLIKSKAYLTTIIVFVELIVLSLTVINSVFMIILVR